MAMCFGLVVNFGDNVEGARAAALANPKSTTLQAGGHRIPVHRALTNRTSSYRLLEQFDGDVVAKVGWDPEGFLDPSDLKRDWADELAVGAIDGLVFSEAMHDELKLGENYVEFQPGYRWIPYRGEKPSQLTDD